MLVRFLFPPTKHQKDDLQTSFAHYPLETHDHSQNVFSNGEHKCTSRFWIYTLTPRFAVSFTPKAINIGGGRT